MVKSCLFAALLCLSAPLLAQTLMEDAEISIESEEGLAYEGIASEVNRRVIQTGRRTQRFQNKKTSSSVALSAAVDSPRERDVSQRIWAKTPDRPGSMYISPSTSWGTLAPVDEQVGGRLNTVGGLIGGDYAFQQVGVGAMGGYERVKIVENNDMGTIRIQSLWGQVYTTLLPLKNPDFFVDMIVGGSRTWLHFQRNIDHRTAIGRTKGWEYDLYADMGYNFSFKKDLRVTPIVGIQYTKTRSDPFMETGAGSENAHVGAFKNRSLILWLGGSFGGKIEKRGVIWMPEIRGYWQHQFANLFTHLKITNPCQHTCKTIRLFTGDRNGGVIGGQMQALFGHQYEWFANIGYDYIFSRHISINSMYATLGLNF